MLSTSSGRRAEIPKTGPTSQQRRPLESMCVPLLWLPPLALSHVSDIIRWTEHFCPQPAETDHQYCRQRCPTPCAAAHIIVRRLHLCTFCVSRCVTPHASQCGWYGESSRCVAPASTPDCPPAIL